ncbi:MAG: TatD family deoxyribonuclease [Alphaproteobacteria bacterium]|nr:TatD family deoxyribonuclease [Alphaproteobacteria bacterium]
MLVDSHCHLDFPGLADDLPAVLARAAGAGVGAMLTIGTRLDGFAGVQAIAAAFPQVCCSVGVHPHEAAAEPDASQERLLTLARQAKVVGIGETGLDFHCRLSPPEEQRRAFQTHIEAAQASGLPLIVHAREADAEIAAMLHAAAAKAPLAGVLHCFSSSQRLADAALELGFYVSFSGILTFKNAEAVREVARGVPLDRLLVETDAPYLAPVPMRGKRCEPAFVVHTAAALAGLRGLALRDFETRTTENFFRLFQCFPRPA